MGFYERLVKNFGSNVLITTKSINGEDLTSLFSILGTDVLFQKRIYSFRGSLVSKRHRSGSETYVLVVHKVYLNPVPDNDEVPT